MSEREYELKLRDGRKVTWRGKSAEDAAWRYVDAHPGTCVVATREAPTRFVAGVNPNQIIG